MEQHPAAAPQRDLDAALAKTMAFLARPESYPDPALSVFVRQTHLSWLFLTDTHVYKLKKPVAGELFDFRSLEARRANCEAELRLNRRLASEIYLAVVPVTLAPDGGLALAGTGPPVEWLVKMVRLPQHRLLDAVLRAGPADRADLDRVADRLTAFYRQVPREALAPDALLDRLAGGARKGAAVLRAASLPLLRRSGARLDGILQAWLRAHGDRLTARVAAGRIGELHGDLRPEHVYLGPPAAVIDCLEFDRTLRLLDPVEELSYFALECELLGAAPVGDFMLARYGEDCGDPAAPDLVAFHKAWRGLLRARLCLEHAATPGDRPPSHWLARSAEYLHAGLAHAGRLG
jgi:aminoglycoside phosphotransferase family enzyme